MKTREQLLKEIEYRKQRIKKVLREPDTYGRCLHCQEGEMVITRTSSLYPEGVAYHLKCSHCGHKEVEPLD